ncbi:hypothetical protein [Roseibium sp. RKSG952]|uniref:hypothetical protein n=1 Tax=Roseibium sp. RKSG952 TaxID=2529384 RepID=UPI001FCB6D60|nr:hypothetical protein [Roseibium sp. RKSG952]
MPVTPEEIKTAWDEWGANCGPAAIAAVCPITLAALRPHMGNYEEKRYTNPTLMWEVLQNIGMRFSYRGGDLGQGNWPTYGLARIQWEGPWTKPCVPIQARYGHTHWVGVNARNRRNIRIFDINAIGNGSGWSLLSDWAQIIVPFILEEFVPRADGGWHITHAVELDPARAFRAGNQPLVTK